MQLSSEQENDYLVRLSPVLWSFAHRFCDKFTGYGRIDVNDCFQEVSIVLLKHLRKVEGENDVFPLPFRDFHHALCLHVLSSMPCSVPRRTAGFRRMLQDHGFGVSMDEMLENGVDVSGGVATEYAEVDENASFDKFMSEITDSERELLGVMAHSRSATEAARRLGIHGCTVSRRLSGLKSKYMRDCAG